MVHAAERMTLHLLTGCAGAFMLLVLLIRALFERHDRGG